MDVIVIGDGPGGLSAALFLAKNGQQVVVLGQDKTAMHFAQLENYLGIPNIHGSELQKIGRAQVAKFGGQLRDARVDKVVQTATGYTVTLDGGVQLSARELILSEGKAPRLAQQLGLAFDEATGIETDRNSRTKLGAYVVGRSSRPGRSQAIISAGDGAAAAIDILSRARDENVVDWDQPPKK